VIAQCRGLDSSKSCEFIHGYEPKARDALVVVGWSRKWQIGNQNAFEPNVPGGALDFNARGLSVIAEMYPKPLGNVYRRWRRRYWRFSFRDLGVKRDVHDVYV